MSVIHIPVAEPQKVRELFGERDRFLRMLREKLGIEIIFRDDELRLIGESEQLDRAADVFRELQLILKRKGELQDRDLDQVLSGSPLARELDSEGGIDIFEKARKIFPRSPGQAAYIRAIRQNDLVLCRGPAGCGKTYLAVAMAINALRQETVRKIVLARPAVEAGEKLGFLPGDMLAKVNPFLRPLLDSLYDMLDFESVRKYLEKDVIEIIPLAFMRGRTLNNTFMILDEAQNTTTTQMKMFLTRMGTDSQIVVTGDVTQTDLPPDVSSGLTDAMRRLGTVQGVACVSLSGEDIVRHRLVREIVRAYGDE